MNAKKTTVSIASGPPAGTAALVRLTPGLKEALCKAAASGGTITVKVAHKMGDLSTIVANGKDFNFRSVPERSCLLVEAPSGFEQDGVGKKVGAVTAKLQVQRKLDAEEIARVCKEKSAPKARPKAMKLDSIPVRGASEQTIVKRIVHRPATGDKQKVSPILPKPAGSMGPSAGMKGLAKVVEDSSKVPDHQKQLSKVRRGPTNHLGIASARPVSEKVDVSNDAAIHAASKDDARMCILVLLHEKPYAIKVIQQAVVECYQKTKVKKDRYPAKEYIKRTVISVCNYSARNKYALKTNFNEEVEKFIQGCIGSPTLQLAKQKQKRGNGKSLQAADAVPPSSRPEPVRPSQFGRSNERPRPPPVQPPPTAPQPLGVKATPSPPKPSERKIGPRPKRPLSTTSPGVRTGTPTSDPALSPSSNLNKARKTTMGGPRSSPKEDKNEPQPRQAQIAPAGQSCGEANNRAETAEKNGDVVTARPAKVEKASDVYTPKFLKPGSLDESWFTEYAGREPQVMPDLLSLEQFEEAQVQYRTKYEVYMRLHTLIEENRQYFEGYIAQLSNRQSESEQDAIFSLIRRDWDATGTLSVRWSGAFQTLHEELKSCRQKMENYVKMHLG